MSIIFDLAILIVLGLFAWRGFKRGIVPGISGILVMVLAFYIGNLLAGTFSGEFTSMIDSFMKGYVDDVLKDAAGEVAGEELQIYSVEDIISKEPDTAKQISEAAFIKMGVYEASAGNLSTRVQKYMDETDSTLAGAMVSVTSSVVAYLLVFVIAVILIIIVFTVLANILSLSMRLPGKRRVDDMAGGAIGLLRGLLAVFFFSWVLGYMGLIFPGQVIGKTVLLKFLLNINPIAAILNL